ncbi:MAG: GNAT family N-acetyltransferase [Firmicutes bacterium]|nr:GNAT family N-acetyltransferase [Bacillota bacterium]
MRFQQYCDVHTFYGDTYDTLMRGEAQNLILLGNLMIGEVGADKTGWRDPANWFMAAVLDGESPELVALMTPPHNLTLYETDNRPNDDALTCLVEGIIKSGVALPGVMTESTLANRFAAAYTAAVGGSFAVRMRQRIYELTRVSPEIPAIGELRLARESDLSFLPYWFEGFESECFHTPFAVPAEIERCRRAIGAGRLYILEDSGISVSMAQIQREMRTACGVSLVYTPPYFRNRGYASACVAGVSRVALERGFAKCVLYTDLDNPTSNDIYQKIGYAPLCDSLEIEFQNMEIARQEIAFLS